MSNDDIKIIIQINEIEDINEILNDKGYDFKLIDNNVLFTVVRNID